jgi:transcriptional regulator with XRE-family HTH domain
MSTQDKINETIQNRLKELKMTNAKLASLMGISAQHVGQLFKNNRKWHTELQDKAFEALGIKVTYKVKKERRKKVCLR